ncbi:hypothetical protein ACFL2H_10590, partial [Planctomycetota bacterium]
MNKEVMRQAIDLLHPDAPCIELRCMGNGMYSGFYDDRDKLIDHAAEFNKAGFAPYTNAQPLKEFVKNRVTNKPSRAMPGACTSNADIDRIQWLIVDLDPHRPSGVCATDEEKQAVAAKMAEMKDYLTRLGLPVGIEADSGNGGYLVYRLDRDIDPNLIKRFFKAAQQQLCDIVKIVASAVEIVRTDRLGDEMHDDTNLIRQVMGITRCDEDTAAKALAIAFAEFDGVPVVFDTAFSRPMQIIRLLGSDNVKGENTPERPHRESRIIHLPSQDVVAAESLTRLADTYYPIRRDPQLPLYKGKYDKAVEHWCDWLTNRQVGFNVVELECGTAIRLDSCPMRNEPDGGAAIIVHPDRGVWGSCYHTSCKGKNLEDILVAIDPKYKDKIEMSVANDVLLDNDNIRKVTDPDRLARMLYKNHYEV